MATLIELDSVSKVYRTGDVTLTALRGASLTVLPGEFAAIVGASGSGKSTLMNILGLLDRPSAGTYRFEGEDVSRLGRTALAKLRNRKLGFVFQGFNLLKRNTLVENIEMPMIYAQVPAGVRRKKALELLDLVRLDPSTFANRRPNQISGGQQQRVAIARALVNDPKVLLADEPTGNLDSKVGAEILDEFRRLNRDLAQTIIMVTHDLGIAAAAHRRITVQDGAIVSDVIADGGNVRRSELTVPVSSARPVSR